MKSHPPSSSKAPVRFRMPTAENLIPIRLDVENEGQRFKDSFTWNPTGVASAKESRVGKKGRRGAESFVNSKVSNSSLDTVKLFGSNGSVVRGLAFSRGIIDTYEGQRLDSLLDKIWRSIELAKLVKGEFPDKIWIKQQFAIGVNDVTRLLERMAQGEATGDTHEISCRSDKVMKRATLVPLQVVLLAADCNPKWLTKHIPTLSSSRKVPVILVRDGKGGSLRLGELLKLKTALAIGVKARGSCINTVFEEII